jgi:hypothetical protein
MEKKDRDGARYTDGRLEDTPRKLKLIDWPSVGAQVKCHIKLLHLVESAKRIRLISSAYHSIPILYQNLIALIGKIPKRNTKNRRCLDFLK